MSKDHTAVESPENTFPAIRDVKSHQIFNWLKLGLNDLRQSGLASLFYGLVFAAAGILIHTVLFKANWLLSALTTGFLLVGPFLAMGLYDLSKQIESDKKPRLLPSLTSWRQNLTNVGIFAGALVIVLLIWARASMVVFALFFQEGLPTFNGIMMSVITLKEPIFTLVYFATGGFCAAFIFGISVIAMPLMADRNTDAITAALASLVAVFRNPIPMLLWALTIVVLVVIGFSTYFLGLVITMPIIGHASWHAYRDLVEN